MASISTSNSANHSYSYKANASSGSASSNVGSRQLYEDGDQRNDPQSEIRERERYKEGQPGSHLANDSSKSPSPRFLVGLLVEVVADTFNRG